MYNEISVSDKSKIVIYKNYDFWDKIINNYVKLCDSITIITYNMNFDFYGESGFIKKITKLLDKGCYVRLIYAKANSTEKVNNLINNFGIIGKCTDNHSKIFYSDNVAYIGSSNFSYGSDGNIESGFITTDKEVVKRMSRFVLPIFDSSSFKWVNLPRQSPVNYEVEDINVTIVAVQTIANQLRDGKKIAYDDLDNIHHRLINIGMYSSLRLEKQDIDFFCKFSDSFAYCEDKTTLKELLEVLDGILAALNDYLLQIKYCLARGGAIRLYYEEGEFSAEDLTKMFDRCDGNYSVNESNV